MLADVSYTHRLDPRTDANLTAAILAVGNLLGISPIADSVLDHLKDRIGDTLSATQRLDPNAIYAADILGRVTEYVKDTFGIDKPTNLHAAPQGPQTKEIPIGSDSVFALDGLGRNRFELLTGGTSGSYARMVADTAMSSAAYSAMTVWNPSSGAAGLSEFNFGGTPFAQNGLDLGTTKYLYGQGFNPAQILAAAQDAKALGLNPTDRHTANAFATLERFDPAGRQQRRAADQAYDGWLKQNRDQIEQLQSAAENAPTEAGRLEAREALNQLLEQGREESGLTAVHERIDEVPDRTPEERRGAHDEQRFIERQIEQRNGVSAELRADVGDKVARDISDDQIANDAPEASDTGGFFDAAPVDVAPAAGAAPSEDEQPASVNPAPEEAEPAKPQPVKPPIPSGPGGIGHA